ncbi:MAG: hypothetical protein Q7J48_06520 [Nocardioides sp.]|nr:hypothetical protein [Nocardioides sp.]
MITSFAPPLIADAVHRWAVESQQRARRNAMLAATECAQRRAEREEVDQFFAALHAASAGTADTRAARG